MTEPKSIAGHVLATGEATDAEARTLAAAVLSNVAADARPEPEPTVEQTRSRLEMQALLRKIVGVEGQRERADMLRAKIAAGRG